jgi:hypothetical protein
MSDALERIKNRQRPEVTKRDPGMTAAANQVVDTSLDLDIPTDIPRILDTEISTNTDIDNSRYPDTKISKDVDIDNSRYPDIQISTPLEAKQEASPALEVKQTTLRLDKQIAADLQALCQREQICREVAIEAMFLAVTNDPVLCKSILAEARTRQRKRTNLANHKRATSMLQRFEG